MDLMNIFDLPLTDLISARADMSAAMAKLTGDTLPGNSWEYLTVGELLSLMEGADNVYKCGAVKPLFEGILERYDSVAEVFIFGRAPLFEGTRNTPYLVIDKCMKEVRKQDGVFLWISTNYKGIEDRRQITKLLLDTYDKVFGRIIRKHGICDNREDVLMKLAVLSTCNI
ncbi:MAG: hypothetical protein IKP14_08300 [Clostridiales bacterium]|nr:hypothetical protein [Clostridiales bacterium]